jgi:hypothetical protein
MWSQYGRQGDGIAIKTTVGKLMDSFARDNSNEVRISEIGYINYKQEIVPWDRIYLFKRLSYRHERELRAFTCPGLSIRPNPNSGVTLAIDPDGLINEVRIGPSCGKRLLTTVQASLSRWNLGHKNAKESELSDLPV